MSNNIFNSNSENENVDFSKMTDEEVTAKLFGGLSGGAQSAPSINSAPQQQSGVKSIGQSNIDLAKGIGSWLMSVGETALETTGGVLGGFTKGTLGFGFGLGRTAQRAFGWTKAFLQENLLWNEQAAKQTRRDTEINIAANKLTQDDFNDFIDTEVIDRGIEGFDGDSDGLARGVGEVAGELGAFGKGFKAITGITKIAKTEAFLLSKLDKIMKGAGAVKATTKTGKALETLATSKASQSLLKNAATAIVATPITLAASGEEFNMENLWNEFKQDTLFGVGFDSMGKAKKAVQNYIKRTSKWELSPWQIKKKANEYGNKLAEQNIASAQLIKPTMAEVKSGEFDVDSQTQEKLLSEGRIKIGDGTGRQSMVEQTKVLREEAGNKIKEIVEGMPDVKLKISENRGLDEFLSVINGGISKLKNSEQEIKRIKNEINSYVTGEKNISAKRMNELFGVYDDIQDSLYSSNTKTGGLESKIQDSTRIRKAAQTDFEYSIAESGATPELVDNLIKTNTEYGSINSLLKKYERGAAKSAMNKGNASEFADILNRISFGLVSNKLAGTFRVISLLSRSLHPKMSEEQILKSFKAIGEVIQSNATITKKEKETIADIFEQFRKGNFKSKLKIEEVAAGFKKVETSEELIERKLKESKKKLSEKQKITKATKLAKTLFKKIETEGKKSVTINKIKKLANTLPKKEWAELLKKLEKTLSTK